MDMFKVGRIDSNKFDLSMRRREIQFLTSKNIIIIQDIIESGRVGISADIGILNRILILFRRIHLFKD